ncbi:MAG: GNAT family N-acetyltransferase [Pseudomonadota bacterium]
MTENHVIFRRAIMPGELPLCHEIRRVVFVEGQNVPQDLEVDGRDRQCMHWLGFDSDVSFATARVMPLPDKLKIQRVAVLEAYQGRGFGGAIMATILHDLRELDTDRRPAFLSSQVHAIPFYERLGFEVCSASYLEAGIEHRDMKRLLSPA